MNPKVIITRLINLLFFQSILKQEYLPLAQTKILIASVLKDLDNLYGVERSLLEECVGICNDLIAPGADPLSESDIIHRITLAADGDESFIEAIAQSISLNKTDDLKEKAARGIAVSLRRQLKEKTFTDLLNRTSLDLKFKNADIDNFDSFVEGRLKELETLLKENRDIKETLTIRENFLDLRNREMAAIAVEGFKEKHTEDGDENVIQFGIKAINEMFGRKGLRDGDFVSLLAMRHHGKSTTLRMLERQAVMYNSFTSKSGKPIALIHIELEDDIDDVIKEYVSGIIANKDKYKGLDPEKMTNAELEDLLMETQEEAGWHILTKRMHKDETSIGDIFNFLMDVDKVYEIKLIGIDYLIQTNDVGYEHYKSYEKIYHKLNDFRLFIKKHGWATIAPHQLATDAHRIFEECGGKNFVKRLRGLALYHGAKAIGQIFDVEIYIALERHMDAFQNMVTYTTWQQDKNKSVKDVPESHKYAAYPMTEGMNSLVDDLLLEDRLTVKRVGDMPKSMVTNSSNLYGVGIF